MKSPNQKLKLLYLMEILLKETDEDNMLTVNELIEKLQKRDVSAERKSIYDDLEFLRLFGLDIVTHKGKSFYYYIGDRDFQLAELKLLVDAVQSSKFITGRKSMELISKIEGLTSKGNAKKLHRQVFVTNRVKTFNEKIYYSIDVIHDAIAKNKQIKFRYFNFNTDKEKVYRKDGEFYHESPVALTWDDENYYLITYKSKYGNYAHYRVDKMDNVGICEESRILADESFDLSKYVKSVFSMFGGEETEISAEFDDSLIGVILDRFGNDVPVIKGNNGRFKCHFKAAVSDQFFGWFISFGTRAKILSPEPVVEQMKKMISALNEVYDNDK